MSSSNSRIDALYGILGNEILDNVIALAIIGVFLVVSFDYDGPVGQFPRVFLISAFVLMLINLAINVAPDPYGNSLKVFTQGVADMMDSTDDEIAQDTESEKAESEALSKLVLGLGMIAILVGYFALSLLIGFVYPIPIVALVIIYVYGEGGIVPWIAMSVIMMALVYYLFGELMYVPVMDGELL